MRRINLDDLLSYFLKKWKIFLVIIVTCVLVFTGATILFGNEIVVPDSEDYVYFEERIEWTEDYIENSILMQLDFRNIYERKIYLNNVTDAIALKDYVTSTEIWKELKDDVKKAYLAELVTWNQTESEDTIEIVLRHKTSEKCEQYATYLAEQINDFDLLVETIVGVESIVADDLVLEHQLDTDYYLVRMEQSLEEADAGYEIHVNSLAAAITGVFAGTLFSTVLVSVLYLFRRKNED